MDERGANLVRKKLPCLRCRRLFWTDRCHRICAKCHRLRRAHGVWELLSDLYGLEGTRNRLARFEHDRRLTPPRPRRRFV